MQEALVIEETSRDCYREVATANRAVAALRALAIQAAREALGEGWWAGLCSRGRQRSGRERREERETTETTTAVVVGAHV